ncbi:MAG: TlpA family protein disulfide reductase [Solirubrobacteraceae bacterium]
MTAERGPLRYAGRVAAAVLAVAFVALLAYGLANKSGDTTIDDSLSRARAVPAPAVDLPVLLRATGSPAARRTDAAAADGRVSLRELRGAPVVLNFWASWCLPCRDEAPVLERAWRRQGRQGALFVGLNQQDITDDSLAFARQLGVTYLTIRDRGNAVARRFGVSGLPETFFVSPAGNVVGHVIGVVSTRQLRDGIAAATAGRPLGVHTGGERRGSP